MFGGIYFRCTWYMYLGVCIFFKIRHISFLSVFLSFDLMTLIVFSFHEHNCNPYHELKVNVPLWAGPVKNKKILSEVDVLIFFLFLRR